MEYRKQPRMDHKRKTVSLRKFRTTTDVTLGMRERRNGKRNLGSPLRKIRLSGHRDPSDIFKPDSTVGDETDLAYTIIFHIYILLLYLAHVGLTGADLPGYLIPAP